MAADARQDISSHDIDYGEEVGSCLIWGRILTACVTSKWQKDTKCKYMFMFLLKNLARKGLWTQTQLVMLVHSATWGLKQHLQMAPQMYFGQMQVCSCGPVDNGSPCLPPWPLYCVHHSLTTNFCGTGHSHPFHEGTHLYLGVGTHLQYSILMLGTDLGNQHFFAFQH